MGERAGSARGSTPGASRAARIEQGETQSLPLHRVRRAAPAPGRVVMVIAPLHRTWREIY